MGRSFGGLDNDSTPPFLEDMDNSFVVAGIKANFWLIYQVLRWLPFAPVKHFLESNERLRQVSSTHVAHLENQTLTCGSMGNWHSKIMSRSTAETLGEKTF